MLYLTSFGRSVAFLFVSPRRNLYLCSGTFITLNKCIFFYFRQSMSLMLPDRKYMLLIYVVQRSFLDTWIESSLRFCGSLVNDVNFYEMFHDFLNAPSKQFNQVYCILGQLLQVNSIFGLICCIFWMFVFKRIYIHNI
jgi:hypothetical protein